MEFKQQNDHHAATELPNPRLEQRPRTMETPLDTGLIVTRVMSMNAI